MKEYREIRRIIAEELGFTDLAAYKKWIEDVRPRTRLTRERIEKLSPDNIDCRAFWKVCEELFGVDPVCNVAVPPSAGTLPHPIETHMDANRMNLRFAKSLGVIAFVEEFAESRLKTLEIGTGFGSLKNYVEAHTKHIYTGVDVLPRIPGVVQATQEGLIPRNIVEEERGLYAYVISSNVFQHLSAKQRSRYYEDAHALLRQGGLFIFNLLVDTAKLPSYLRDETGNAWCDHYGQYTLTPKASDVYDELGALFAIMYVTQRYDGVFNFVCQKRG